MEELLSMGAFSGGDLALDAGMVAAVNEMTNWVKARLDEWTWDDQYARFYPVVPFACAFALSFLVSGLPFDMEGLSAVAKQSMAYGAAATVTWNLYKKSIKGD